MSKPFGEDLWRNVEAIRIDPDGTFRAPVEVGRGVVAGVGALAGAPAGRDPARRPGPLARLRARLRRR